MVTNGKNEISVRISMKNSSIFFEKCSSILDFGTTGSNVLVSKTIDSLFSNESLLSEGVRKHLWRLAYPEKLYFVGELTSMTTFSPKMVTKNIVSKRQKQKKRFF